MDNRPIGIFDSGVGGLTVVKEVLKYLPNEQIIYFGDTARVPYGGKSKETLIKYSRQIIKFLCKKDVKGIIIACGTASSNALSTMREEFKNLPIEGIVKPGAKVANLTTKNNKIGIIATESTIKSGAYEKLIKGINPSVEVVSKACPLFVPIAEEGWSNTLIAELTAQEYLKDIVKADVDTLVLGCTHYPLLVDCIRKTVGNDITLINTAAETAKEFKNILEQNNALRLEKNLPEHRFYVSDNTEKFDKLSLEILNKSYKAEKIDIDKY